MYTVDRHLSLRRVVRAAVHPGGTWAAVEAQRLSADGARFVSDLWRVPLDGAGPAERLTRGEVSCTSPAFREDGALAFLCARPDPATPGKEGEAAQVWILPAEGGEAFPLTDEPLGIAAFRFAGDTLATLASVLPDVALGEAKERAKDLREKGPSARHYRDLPARWWDAWLGPDEPHLVVRRASDGGDRRDLTPAAGNAHREAAWALSPDGRSVALTFTRRGADRIDEHVLRVLDVATGEGRDVLAAPRRLVSAVVWSEDGARLAVVVEDRRPRLAPERAVVELDLGGGAPRELPGTRGETCHDPVPDGDGWLAPMDLRGHCPIVRLAAAGAGPERRTTRGVYEGLARIPGGGVVAIHHTLEHPPEVVRVEGDGVHALAKLSGFEEGEAGIRVEEAVATSPDGSDVHGFVVRPAGEARPRAALVWVHGGPIGAWSDGWQWRWTAALAANAGYIVALPNPRGSTGYGQTFIDGVWANQYGGACADDVLAWADLVDALPDVLPGRVAAMGASFGGYMVNWLAGQTTRFAAIVCHAGLFDLRAFLSTDAPEWWVEELDGDPWSDPAAFERYSPHRFAPRWRSPMLFLHGERDYRVPVGEGLLAWHAARFHGVDAELVVFPDENHWILKPRNVRAWAGAIFTFLDRHMGSTASGSSGDPSTAPGETAV